MKALPNSVGRAALDLYPHLQGLLDFLSEVKSLTGFHQFYKPIYAMLICGMQNTTCPFCSKYRSHFCMERLLVVAKMTDYIQIHTVMVWKITKVSMDLKLFDRICVGCRVSRKGA